MATREAWRIPAAGSLERLALVTEDLAPPGPGEARIRVEAIGLNFADVFACLGLYSATPRGAFVPGLECAGIIEALGESGDGPPAWDSPNWHVGDRVIVLTRFGGYATALNVDTRYLLPLPEGWTPLQGAAYPVQALTAWYGLVQLGSMAPAHVVLVHSAAGGVGLHALAMAKTIGARAIATVGHREKAEFLVSRGFPAERIFVRDASQFGAQLDTALEAVGARGFDVVFDALAGAWFLPALTRLVPEGRHVIYGAADFMPSGARPNWARLAWRYVRRPRLDPMRLIDTNRSVLGFNLIWLFDRADRLPDATAAALRLSASPPHVGSQFSFAEMPRALRTLQAGRTTGKVVVTIP
jgi:alcohol dehydrogenase